MATSQSSPRRLGDLQAVVDDPLELDDVEAPQDVVGGLSPQGFVRVARRLRDENRLELVLPHASPEQLTSLLDLDAWDSDRVDLERARMWIVAIADAFTGGAKPRGALADLIYEMDPEMWTLVLTPGTTVIDLDPEDDGSADAAMDALAGLRTWPTPDGFFIVGVPDDDHGQLVLAILHMVYADDLGQGRKLALAAQSSIASQLEEELLRWRSGRLADMGFVGWEEAMKLFRPLDYRAAARQTARDFAYLPDDQIGWERLVAWSGSELLRAVMGRLPDAEHGLRSREFLLVVNEVMAAQRFPPGNESLQERAIDQAQATISLGLELLAATEDEHPDIEAFLAGRVVAVGLRDVFRIGYGALDKLRRTAVALHREGRVSLTAPGSLLDRPWGPAIAAFARWYPEFPLQDTSSRTRPIRSLKDVARATLLIAQAGALHALAFSPQGYALDPIWISRADEPERLALGDLIRTAIVHAALSAQDIPVAPLSPDDMAWARDNLLDGSRLVTAVGKDFSARCDALGLGDHAQALAENVLTRLRMELIGLEFDDGEPDLTKVGGFLTVQQVGMWLKTAGAVN